MSTEFSMRVKKPSAFIGRGWQLKAHRKLSKLREKGQQEFLLVASPAAGKTRFAVEVARTLLSEGVAQRVVVVSHSDHLRRQWARVAEDAGLKLDPTWSNANGVEANEFQGVVVTYQQVAAAPHLFRLNCNNPTLAIFDEIHHVSDRASWGEAVRTAFEAASFRLGMSGTLFRSDRRKIPFVRYEQGCSRPDFIYGYAEAIADNVCRPLYFHTYEGEIVWLREGSEKLYEHSLTDLVDYATSAERLRVALDPTKQWLRRVITDADRHLTGIREQGHPDAGGLIIAMNQLHAKRIARLVREICGEEPVVAISEDPEASERIAEFSHGTQRWIVAVRMVSEGVDIPRLRIGVYASHVRTEMFFRQVCGRFIRYTPGLREQSAVVYMPADETLKKYAATIKEEREYVVAPDAEEEPSEQFETGVIDGAEWGEHLINALSAEPKEHDAIFNGDVFVQPELTFAAKVCRQMGITTPFVQVASLIRLGAAQAGVYVRHEAAPTASPFAAPVRAMTDRPKPLRERVEAITQNLADCLGVTVDEIHQEWVNLGGMRLEAATTEDLERRFEWLRHRFADERATRGYKVGMNYYSLDNTKKIIGEPPLG